MIETISNEDMRDILSMGRDMADLAGKAGRDKQNPGISRVEATVTAVNDDGSLTVNLGSATRQILRTYKMTSACYGAKVGDRVIVDTLNHISYITGILARDNGHYVKEGCKTLFSNSSGVYMNAAQTASLSEPLSAQGKGIVLHWQAYTPGTGVHDYQHNFIFVPKTFNRGAGLGMLLMAGSRLVTKYVYIYDDRINGNANNSAQDTISGVSIDNRYQVLTEVLGL